MSAPKSPTSSATKFFSIAELTEQILLDFVNIPNPNKTASTSLLGIKRVSHSFNTTISTTPSLQRVIHLGHRPKLEYCKDNHYRIHNALNITMSHGAHVDFAFFRATECWVDTEGESWRDIVFLGSNRDGEDMEFGNVQLHVEAGETFGSIVERVRELQMRAAEHKKVMLENAVAYGFLDEDDCVGKSWTVHGV
ncbi:hypothetical protein HII31_03975 [Pseudocercospora fuligena]|uniref:Uncharacterized protein n=1 Tax=Pseudocercospora fuligena TaxID=685502 RepID=A0A8H6VJF5_9PEZI|nr:hypothetical protein HII31_03975 [Pseudocercospora fuligena]